MLMFLRRNGFVEELVQFPEASLLSCFGWQAPELCASDVQCNRTAGRSINSDVNSLFSFIRHSSRRTNGQAADSPLH